MSETENIVSIGDPMPRLVSVSYHGAYEVAVSWASGLRERNTDTVDLGPVILAHKFYRPLRDNPDLLKSVHVIADGTAIAWGDDDDVDLAAATIERLAEETMSSADFRAWLERHKLTYDAAAAQLGISRRLVAYYASKRDLPRYIALACRYLDTELAPDLPDADRHGSGLSKLEVVAESSRHRWGGDGFSEDAGQSNVTKRRGDSASSRTASDRQEMNLEWEIMQRPRYQERYCAFVDILGFGTLIERLREGQTAFEFLQGLLAQVHNPLPALQQSWDTDFHAQSISDAVALSTLPNEMGLVQLLNATEQLTLDLLQQGFFVRGIILRGKLFHDDKMAFGETLVRAYEIERQVVRFPRVMLTKDVVEDLLRFRKDNRIGKDVIRRIRQSQDGPSYVHVLRDAELLYSGNQPRNPKHDHDFFTNIRTQLSRRLEASVDHPGHFEKVKWFADYWDAINEPLNGGINNILWPLISYE